MIRSPFTEVRCSYQEHGPAIRNILNEVITESTTLYDYNPRSMADIESWFKTKQLTGYPVIGFMDGDSLAGFTTLGPFRQFSAYKYTVEHSLYVASNYRGQGLGNHLLVRIIDEAKALDLPTLIGVIDANNVASIGLHQAHGFKHCGSLNEVGYKFDKWLSVELYQLLLDTPHEPVADIGNGHANN